MGRRVSWETSTDHHRTHIYASHLFLREHVAGGKPIYSSSPEQHAVFVSKASQTEVFRVHGNFERSE